jgi:hypothetical protein
MAKDIRARIDEAFEGRDIDEYTLDFLRALRETRNAVASAMNRDMALVVALIVTFELLINSVSKDLKWGPLSIDDTDPVLVAIPVVTAYFLLEVVLHLVRVGELRTAHTRLTAIVRPLVERNDLESLLDPPSRAIITVGSGMHSEIQTAGDTVRTVIIGWITLGSLLVPIVLEVRAYYLLLSHDVGSLPWVVLSAAISLVLLVAVCAIFGMWAAANVRSGRSGVQSEQGA